MQNFPLIDRIPIGLFMITSEFKIVFWNACFEDWTGIKKKSVLQKDVREIFPRLNEQRYQSRLLQLFEDGLPFVLSYQLNGDLFSSNSKDHKDRIHHCTITAVQDTFTDSYSDSDSGGLNKKTLALFAIEDRTEVAMRTKVARVELLMRYEVEKELRTALDEKVMLMKELNHRVKNNLNMVRSLITLQCDSLTDERSIAVFRDLETRISSIALLHEMLYKTSIIDNISLDSYLDSLCRNIFSTFLPDEDDRTLILELEPVTVSTDITLHIGLIISELLTNAIKYGLKNRTEGRVSVILKTKNGKVDIVISDDGPGLPAGFDISLSSSLGMKLVYMITAQLQGSVTFLPGSASMPGAAFRLSIPANKID